MAMLRISFLKVIETVDLAAVLAQMPECRHLCTTGGKATEVLLEIQGSGMKMPKTGETVPFPYAGRDLTLTRLPSTSRAYPLSLAKKAAAYRAFFEMAGLTVFQGRVMDRYEISVMTFMALWWLFNVVSVWLKGKQWHIKVLLGGTLLYVIQIPAVIMSVNGLNWIFLNVSTINTNELIIALLCA